MVQIHIHGENGKGGGSKWSTLLIYMILSLWICLEVTVLVFLLVQVIRFGR